jgi:hypothetical protein
MALQRAALVFAQAAAGRWIRVLAVGALLAAGCGSVNSQSAGIGTPSPSSSASPSAAPSIVASPTSANFCNPTNRCLALVTVRGSNQILVRDLTNISQPKTLGNLGAYPTMVGIGAPSAQFVSSSQASYVGGNSDDYYGLPTQLFRVPLTGSPRTLVVSNNKAVAAFAWSPAGGTLAYLSPTGFTGMELHEVHAGIDRVVAHLPAIAVGGCETDPCPGPFQSVGDHWDFRLLFSPDGQHLSVVQNGIDSYFRIWNSDGRLMSSSDSGRTMSVWSGDSLYFLDSKGVEVWRDGVTSTFLAGVQWIRPKASPGGNQIAYEARDAQGSAHVFIVDTASGQVTDLGGKGRAEPAFLTDRYVWYQAEPACVVAKTCEPLVPGIATGKTYVYDLKDHSEVPSIITSVIGVWPHGA